MSDYFKEVEEESIRDNFVICYELLDEMVDFGYPQTTDAKILQEYITQVRVENNRMIEEEKCIFRCFPGGLQARGRAEAAARGD